MGKATQIRTSLADLAQLSVDVYENHVLYLRSGGRGAGASNLHPPGFTLVQEMFDKASNYFGQAWRNDANGELVIVNRGTVANATDLRMDLDIARAAAVPQSAQAALAFARQLAALPAYRHATIICTGHSKGGYEAQYQSARLADDGAGEGARVAAATFDAPALNPAVLGLRQPLDHYEAINVSSATDPVSQLTAAYGLQWPGAHVFIPVANAPPAGNPAGLGESCRRAALRLDAVLNEAAGMADSLGVSPSQFPAQSDVAGAAYVFDSFLRACDLKLGGHGSAPLAAQLRRDLGDLSVSTALADRTLMGHAVTPVMETVPFGAEALRRIGQSVLGVYIRQGHGFGEAGSAASRAFADSVDARFAGKDLANAVACLVDGIVHVRLADGETIWVRPDGGAGSRRIDYFDDGAVLYAGSDADGLCQFVHRDRAGVTRAWIADAGGGLLADLVSEGASGSISLGAASDGQPPMRATIEGDGVVRFAADQAAGHEASGPPGLSGGRLAEPGPGDAVGAAAGNAAGNAVGDSVSAVRGMLALARAIASGDTGAIVAASVTMLADLDRLGDGRQLPDGAGRVLNAVASGIGLLDAIRDGNAAGLVAAGAALGSEAASVMADVLRGEGLSALPGALAAEFSAGLSRGLSAELSSGMALEPAAAMGQLSSALGALASVASLALALQTEDPYTIASASLGAAATGLGMAGMACPPLAIASAFAAFAGLVFGDNDLPTREGEACVVWRPDGGIQVLTTIDAEGGGATPTRLLAALVGALQQRLSAQAGPDGEPLYEVIPQRLPRIGYAYDPDSFMGNAASHAGDAPGHLYLKWTDGRGQMQARYFDGAGSRGQQGQPDLAEVFFQQAVDAVAPVWEARTVFAAMHEAKALDGGETAGIAANRMRAGRQSEAPNWRPAAPEAGLPVVDGDRQHFTMLTVDQAVPSPVGRDAAWIGRDVDLDGFVEQTEWVAASEGILCIDTDGDGRISQRELLTDDAGAAGGRARNSLHWLDANGDGRLDAADPAFARLGVWCDANRSGRVEPGELALLRELGVARLDGIGAPGRIDSVLQLHGEDGVARSVTRRRLASEVRGEARQLAFADADGDGLGDVFAGVLQVKERGETILDAVRTHDYAGEPGHTHGGIPDDGPGACAGEGIWIAAGDARMRAGSDRRAARVCAQTIIAAGDRRVTDGGKETAVGSRTSTMADIGDSRLRGAAPVTLVDALAEARDAMQRRADSVFAGTGMMLAVGAGMTIGAAPARGSDCSDGGKGGDCGDGDVSMGSAGAGIRRAEIEEPHRPGIAGHGRSGGQTAGAGMLARPLPQDVAVASPSVADVLAHARPCATWRGAVGQEVTGHQRHSGSMAGGVGPAPVNGPPAVAGERFEGSEDEAITFSAASLLANDIGNGISIGAGAGDPRFRLAIVAVGEAWHGAVRLGAGGRVTFIPEADHAGAAGFSYTVADPHGASATGRVDITLAPVNDAPRLRDDAIDVIEDTALSIEPGALLANDTDVDDPPESLRIVRVAGARHGLVSMTPDGTIHFTPEQDYAGEAGFLYEATDPRGARAMAAVILRIASANDDPIANDDTVDGRMGVPITITAEALLANDHDVDNPHEDLRIVAVSEAAHGSVRLNADDSVTFVPEPAYGGVPGACGRFTCTVADGAGGFASALVTVSLERRNRTPVAVDDGFSGYENIPFVIPFAGLLANDSDPDGDALKVAGVGGAQGGSVVLQQDHVRFTPDPDFHGRASFRYLAADACGGRTWASALLDVAHINQPPLIEAVEYGRPVFGYYYGPAPQTGMAAPTDGGGPRWASYDELHERDPYYFQPLHDEAQARDLSARGQLFDASGRRFDPAHYRNGMLKPLALEQADSIVATAGASDIAVDFLPLDDPCRQLGRIIAYDPDGDAGPVVLSIVQSPMHGHAWANAQADTLALAGTDQATLARQMTGAAGYWQYFSHRGDPYNGPDDFVVRAVDSRGASTDTWIHVGHRGTNASGTLTPLVPDPRDRLHVAARDALAGAPDVAASPVLAAQPCADGPRGETHSCPYPQGSAMEAQWSASLWRQSLAGMGAPGESQDAAPMLECASLDSLHRVALGDFTFAAEI